VVHAGAPRTPSFHQFMYMPNCPPSGMTTIPGKPAASVSMPGIHVSVPPFAP
jgi:hypothetical protein